MYNDILGDEPKTIEMTKDSIIDAMKDNIDTKQEMINDLLLRITELELELESKENEYHV